MICKPETGMPPASRRKAFHLPSDGVIGLNWDFYKRPGNPIHKVPISSFIPPPYCYFVSFFINPCQYVFFSPHSCPASASCSSIYLSQFWMVPSNFSCQTFPRRSRGCIMIVWLCSELGNVGWILKCFCNLFLSPSFSFTLFCKIHIPVPLFLTSGSVHFLSQSRIFEAIVSTSSLIFLSLTHGFSLYHSQLQTVPTLPFCCVLPFSLSGGYFFLLVFSLLPTIRFIHSFNGFIFPLFLSLWPKSESYSLLEHLCEVFPFMCLSCSLSLLAWILWASNPAS